MSSAAPTPRPDARTLDWRLTSERLGFGLDLSDFGSEVEGFRGRCREDDNPFYALRFDYVLG